jgi:nickel-dependent lactate racemase
LGTHRKHTVDEDALLYGTLTHDFNFTQHDCHGDLASVGKTSTGLDVWVNRRVKEADFVITTGRVDFHYLAGYSGGRKSILPGVASYETIRNNHKKLVRNGVYIGQTDGNVIAQEMAEAASLLGIDYLLNVVETPGRDIAQIFSGNPEGAFQEAVHYFVAARRVCIPERADCVIVSAGGFPQDKNFYHTHKSVNLAMQALKKKGSIILIGQCAEGFGNEKFMQLMLEHEIEALLHYPEDKIDVGGHRAFLTARILKDHGVYVLTDLDPDMVRRISFTPIRSIDEGIAAVKSVHGDRLKTLVIPNGKAVLPSLNGRKSILN